MIAGFTRLSAAAIVVVAVTAPQARAQDGTELGTLDCQIEGEQALVLGAGEGLVCRFEAADGGATDTYFGAIQELAPGFEITPDATIRWTVLSVREGSYSAGQLEGEYQAFDETGAAVDTLVGGQEGDLVLIPVDLPPGEAGENIAPGIVTFQLRTVRA